MRHFFYIIIALFIFSCETDDNGCPGELTLTADLLEAEARYTANSNVENCLAYKDALTQYIDCSNVIADFERDIYREIIAFLPCSDNENTLSLQGTWNLTSIVNAGGPVDIVSTCANENYIVAAVSSGTAYFYFNEDQNGNSVPCFVSDTDNFTYTNFPEGSSQFVFTTESGEVLAGILIEFGTELSITDNDDILLFTKQ
mgnify:FL=1